MCRIPDIYTRIATVLDKFWLGVYGVYILVKILGIS